MNVAFRKPSAKSDILDDAGYLYHFDLRLYINRQEKKAFSLKFLETHSEAEIEHQERWRERRRMAFFLHRATIQIGQAAVD